MKSSKDEKEWQLVSQFADINTPWLKLVGERLIDDEGIEREYWRTEKPHGLLVITIQNGHLILPRQMYRPGLKQRTLDFCGGRITNPEQLTVEAERIVQRELGLGSGKCFLRTICLTNEGWVLDSSFSNVLIFGIIAEIKPKLKIPQNMIGATFTTDKVGIDALLNTLRCLQCRNVLHEAKDSIIRDFQ